MRMAREKKLVLVEISILNLGKKVVTAVAEMGIDAKVGVVSVEGKIVLGDMAGVVVPVHKNIFYVYIIIRKIIFTLYLLPNVLK